MGVVPTCIPVVVPANEGAQEMRQRQNTQHSVPDSSTWAAVLAKSRHRESDHAHDEHMRAPHIDGAALWALFDEAVTTANAALEREGLPERITVDGDDLERTYALLDSSGRSREFKVTVAVGSEDSAFSCSAVLSFSHTRAYIHLVPH